MRIPRAFSLIEVSVVLAIVGIMSAIAVWSFTALKGKLSQGNFASDLVSATHQARLRAMSKQRNVALVILSGTGAASNDGYYELDDLSSAQNLSTPANLASVAGVFNPSVSGFSLPAAYSVRLIGSGLAKNTAFYTGTNAWGTATSFPFPFAATSTNTSGGACSFCTANTGAVAFLPNGRAVFSAASGTPTSGAIVLDQTGQGASGVVAYRKALLISQSGMIESVKQ